MITYLSLDYIDKKISFQPLSEQFMRWVKKYPTIHKIVTVFNHCIRTMCMAAMMVPLGFTGTALGLSTALFYRITTENPCPFKYSLPAFFGGLASQLALFSVFPLIMWTAAVIVISHREVEEARKNSSCCA